VVVDQVEAALEEAGEVIHAVESGLVERSSLIELGDALRTPPPVSGRTVFKSVGLAVQDWAIARLLGAHGASERGGGEQRGAAERRNLAD